MKQLLEFMTLISLLVIHHCTCAQTISVSPFDTTLFGRNQLAGKYVDVNGIKLYYEIYGQREPLLMIHGNGGSISSFINQIPYFSKKYQVIAVDSRAQGKSVDTGDTLSFEMMADDFSALLEQQHMDSCNVLGWSDGGITGLLLAIRHPEKVKKLAITGANLWPDSSAISSADYLWGKNFYDSLCKMQQTPDILHARKLVGLDLFQPNITLEQLKQIKCPTLVIAGDHDIIRTEHTVVIAKSIPRSFLWILPNSSHSTLFDYKDQFNKTVDDFFRDGLKK